MKSRLGKAAFFLGVWPARRSDAGLACHRDRGSGPMSGTPCFPACPYCDGLVWTRPGAAAFSVSEEAARAGPNPFMQAANGRGLRSVLGGQASALARSRGSLPSLSGVVPLLARSISLFCEWFLLPMSPWGARLQARQARIRQFELRCGLPGKEVCERMLLLGCNHLQPQGKY